MLYLGVNRVAELLQKKIIPSNGGGNVLLIGRAGVGKSSIIRAFENGRIHDKTGKFVSEKELKEIRFNAKNNAKKDEIKKVEATIDKMRKISVFDIRLSAYTVNDITISMPKSLTDKEIIELGLEGNEFAKNVMTTFFADWVVKLQQAAIDGDKVVLFFDELTHAQLPVLRIMYRILAEREIDNVQLPTDMVVIGATNKTEEDSQMTELPGPLLDRFEMIIELQENIEDSIQYYIKKKYYTVAAFLKCWDQKLYYSTVSDDITETVSPRTWEKIGVMINEGILQPNDEEQVGDVKINYTAHILKSILGTETAAAFGVFLDDSVKVDIDKYITTGRLDEGTGIKVKYSIFSAVIKKLTTYTSADSDKKKKAIALNFMETVFKHDNQYLSVLLLEEELQHFISKWSKNDDLKQLVYTLC